MREIDWNPTIRGCKARLLGGKYVLEVWGDAQTGDWVTAVNGAFIVDDDTGKSKKFDSLERAKAAAVETLEEMIRGSR